MLYFKLQDENQNLRIEVSQLTIKVQALSAELERRGVPAGGAGNSEHVRLLEEQLRRFHLDFESERRDRQQAQARASELMRQLTAATREVQIFI